jgi:hypothetical protein
MNMEPVVECAECGRLVDIGYVAITPSGLHVCVWCEYMWDEDDIIDDGYTGGDQPD